MRENRLYGSVGGWGLIAPRLPNRWQRPPTAEVVDKPEVIDFIRYRPSMRSTTSILSAVNPVNLVNTVNAVKKPPPQGGYLKTTHRITVTLALVDDFGEIIYVGNARLRRKLLTRLTSQR